MQTKGTPEDECEFPEKRGGKKIARRASSSRSQGKEENLRREIPLTDSYGATLHAARE